MSVSVVFVFSGLFLTILHQSWCQTVLIFLVCIGGCYQNCLWLYFSLSTCQLYFLCPLLSFCGFNFFDCVFYFRMISHGSSFIFCWHPSGASSCYAYFLWLCLAVFCDVGSFLYFYLVPVFLALFFYPVQVFDCFLWLCNLPYGVLFLCDGFSGFYLWPVHSLISMWFFSCCWFSNLFFSFSFLLFHSRFQCELFSIYGSWYLYSQVWQWFLVSFVSEFSLLFLSYSWDISSVCWFSVVV